MRRPAKAPAERIPWRRAGTAAGRIPWRRAGTAAGRISRHAGPVFALLLALASACARDPAGLVLVGSVERTALELTAPRSEPILAIPVERGERVEAGRVLVVLDPTLVEAEVARDEAVLAGARTAKRVADRELTRARRLRGRDVASQRALENAELAAEEARAALREAEARLAATRRRLAELTVTAPQGGVVDQLPFEVGERVPVGGVLAVVLSDAAPWVRVWIPEQQATRVRSGTPAHVRIDGYSTPFAASVLDLTREPSFTPHYALTERDRVHLVYEARIVIHDAPLGLRPGLPADVLLDLDMDGAHRP